jgi:hypothetical protein
MARSTCLVKSLLERQLLDKLSLAPKLRSSFKRHACCSVLQRSPIIPQSSRISRNALVLFFLITLCATVFGENMFHLGRLMLVNNFYPQRLRVSLLIGSLFCQALVIHSASGQSGKRLRLSVGRSPVNPGFVTFLDVTWRSSLGNPQVWTQSVLRPSTDLLLTGTLTFSYKLFKNLTFRLKTSTTWMKKAVNEVVGAKIQAGSTLYIGHVGLDIKHIVEISSL